MTSGWQKHLRLNFHNSMNESWPAEADSHKMITTLLVFAWSKERKRWGERQALFLRGCSLNYKTWAEKRPSAPVRSSLFRSLNKPDASGYFSCADEVFFFLLLFHSRFPLGQIRVFIQRLGRSFLTEAVLHQLYPVIAAATAGVVDSAGTTSTG